MYDLYKHMSRRAPKWISRWRQLRTGNATSDWKKEKKGIRRRGLQKEAGKVVIISAGGRGERPPPAHMTCAVCFLPALAMQPARPPSHIFALAAKAPLLQLLLMAGL